MDPAPPPLHRLASIRTVSSASTTTRIPGGFDTEPEDDASPTKTEYDDAASTFGHSRQPSRGFDAGTNDAPQKQEEEHSYHRDFRDQRRRGVSHFMADEDSSGFVSEAGHGGRLNESEVGRRLMEVESSFLPELSPIVQERDEGSSLRGADDSLLPGLRGTTPPTVFHAPKATAADYETYEMHHDQYPSDVNTSALETMSSSPTAAATARTISRVVSIASLGGYETAEEESTMEQEVPMKKSADDLTPTKEKAQPTQILLEPASPSPAKPLPSGDPFGGPDGTQDGYEADGVGGASKSPRKRPKYLSSRFASQRSSYSSQATSDFPQDGSDHASGADYALQSGGGQALGSSTSSRDLSRSISLGSMASGVSKLNENDSDNDNEFRLGTLPEEGTPHASVIGDRGRDPLQTPRVPSGFSTNTPTDTVINQRVKDFEVPGTIARKFYQESDISPERRYMQPTPVGSRVKNLSLKEQGGLIDKLQKENWKLKLKLYFMDQTVAERSDESVKAMISENVELKTLKFSNTKEIRSMRRNIRELEYKLKERDETIAGHKAKEKEHRNSSSFGDTSQDLDTEISYLRERVETYEVEIDQLRTDNARKEGEKRRLAEMVSSVGDRSKVGSDLGAREEVDMWKDLLEAETARKEQADEENRRLREENWKLKADAASAASARSDTSRTRVEVTKATNGTISEDSTAVEQLRHENAELRREVGAQTSMLTSRNREKERLYQEIEDLKMGQRRADGRSDVLDRSVSRAHVRSSSRTSSLTRVTQIGDGERELFETRNNELRDQAAKLKMENQQLAEEMEKLLDELDALGNTRADLDKLQKMYDDLTEETNQEMLAMQRERDDALHQQERAELDFQDLKAEAQERIDVLEDELDQNSEAIKQLEDEIAAREEESTALRNEVRMTSEGLDKVEADVQSKVRRIKELELENEDITRELEGIEKSSIEVNAKNEKLSVELESRQSECAFLREEQDGYMLKLGELESSLKSARASLTAEKDRVRDLDGRLAEERHQREVIGGKREQEQQKIMNDLNREATGAKDEARKLRKTVETREVEVTTWRERLEEFEGTFREVLGDPSGSRASFIANINKLQHELEKTSAELASARQSLAERERTLQRRDALLESHGLESRKLNDLLEKERTGRRNDRVQHEQWVKTHAHTSHTVGQKDKRITELEQGRSSDRRKISRLEAEFREQLGERNALLLSLWHKLSGLCGADWQHQNSLVSGHLPTLDVVSNMLPGFSKNLLLAVRTLDALVAGFRARVKQIERDLTKDYRNLEDHFNVRIKRLDRLESAVQLSRVSSAASAAPEIARLRGENKLLKGEVHTLQKQEAVRQARHNAVSIEPATSTSNSNAAGSGGGGGGGGGSSRQRAPSTLARHHSEPPEGGRPDSGRPGSTYGSVPYGTNGVGDAEAAAIGAMVQAGGDTAGQNRWIHRLRELEKRLKAEREGRVLDRGGARKRIEERDAENQALRAELEREKERRKLVEE